MIRKSPMKKTGYALAVVMLTACASPPLKVPPNPAMNDAINDAVASIAVPVAMPPALPVAPALPPEAQEVISVNLNNVPARQFFMALAAGTRYTMLVHPNVSGTLSAKLSEVTVPEALDAIRDVYGIDYAITGRRITIKLPELETRVFQVNYLMGSRKGNSDTRVAAGSLGDAPATPGSVPSAPVAAPARATDSSRVSSTSDTDFWSEIKAAMDAIVGGPDTGRSIVISPQSGVVVVRAMPKELRDVTAFLKATQLSVERQVILEAKIIEVQLADSYQSGINWAGFRNSGQSRASAGVLQPGTSLSRAGSGGRLSSGTLNALPGADLAAAAAASGSLFGVALQGASFSALISFLETQGMVQVLSSPRISTLNNQKAVLKIGTDEFFVTGVTGGTTTPSSGGAVTTVPNVSLRPFFSGVVLDVLPQIDASGNIILHIRPSVSQVSTVNKNINLGSGGQLSLPLASSSASEADSVVRAKNGQVVVIGGLMRQSGSNDRSQVPGAGRVAALGELLGNTSRSQQKRELVILLKPTVIESDGDWAENLQQTRTRLHQLGVRGKEVD